MRIGFGRADITPPLGTLLSGQPEAVRARGVASRLYARAMCLDDGHTCVLLGSCDVLVIPNGLHARIARLAAQATGVPARQIILGATHTHSGPNTAPIFGKAANDAYTGRFEQQVLAALTQAHATRVAASLRVASGTIDGWAFNRRFLMTDGTIETHPLKGNPHLVGPEGPDSRRLDVFGAFGAGGRPLGGGLVFGCHGTVMPRNNVRISADYPGQATTWLEARLGHGSTALFLQGACGNICQVDPRNPTRREVGHAWAVAMGRAVARRGWELLMRPSPPVTGRLRVLTRTLRLQRRQVSPALRAWARRHQPRPVAVPVLSDYGVERYGTLRPPKVSLGELFGTPFWANFYAGEIRTMAALARREPVVPFVVTVIALGPVAWVFLPCELFIEWAEQIQAASPFPHTLVIEMAGGWNGYVPTPGAFARSGGYETKELSSTFLAATAGERILSAVTEMLGAAHGR